MDIKTLEELQQPDERSLRSAPFGRAAAQRPEDAADYLQQAVGHLDLVAQVPDRVRDAFEQVREVYAHGVLFYDLYGAAHDRARLVVEYALRERFLEYHAGSVTFVDASDELHTLQPATFGELFHLLHDDEKPLLRKPHSWKLQLRGGTTMWFNGMLTSLVKWARAEGLLNGQRSRHHETILKDARDRAAHATGYNLMPPAHAAQAISDLAEIINRLWGATTPGGRLYPAPVCREVLAVGWRDDGKLVVIDSVIGFRTDMAPEGLTYVLVRAKPDDGELAHYDSLYETTYVPCELLWGPGSWSAAVAWFEREQPVGDQVDVLDRLFLVRYSDQRLYLPRAPHAAAALGPDERGGTWYLLRADAPLDAFNHLRCLLACSSGCALADPCRRAPHTPQGPCKSERCPVDTLYTGLWSEALKHSVLIGSVPSARSVPDVRVSPRMPRYNIIEPGAWQVPP